MLVPLRKAIKLTGLSPNTLRKYADDGIIKAQRLGKGKQRLFDVSDLLKARKDGGEEYGKPVVCYCRVSTPKQKDDLARQVAYMRQQFPNADIIQDVGSGLNFKRKGLQHILRRLMQGDKFTLVVPYRDRLCRFGFELFDFLFQQNGGEIMVLDHKETSPQRELTEDLLAILHVFSCRMHGLRKYKDQIKEDKDLSDTTAESAVPSVVRSVEADVQQHRREVQQEDEG